MDSLKRFAEAATDWNQAVDLSPAQEQASVRILRARSLARAGEVELAVDEAHVLAKLPATKGALSVDLARVHVLAAGQDEPNREEHIQNALQLLQRAVAGGFKDAQRLKKDDDLKQLRGRDEFKKLLAELESKQPPTPEPKPGPPKK